MSVLAAAAAVVAAAAAPVVAVAPAPVIAKASVQRLPWQQRDGRLLVRKHLPRRHPPPRPWPRRGRRHQKNYQRAALVTARRRHVLEPDDRAVLGVDAHEAAAGLVVLQVLAQRRVLRDELVLLELVQRQLLVLLRARNDLVRVGIS